jgi:pyroglutamyl-peptidase
MRILMTGFEPFGGETVNPSWEAVSLLQDEMGGAAVSKRRLPVAYAGSEAELAKLIAELKPDYVILTGQAGGRTGVSVECCAINMDHANIPDNAGEKRLFSPISPSGAAAYFTDAPVEKIVESVRAANLPCAPSFSAGTYVCNHVYYRLLESMGRGLFVHVPFIPEQVPGGDRPTMD